MPGETGGMETYARELITALRVESPDLRLTAFVSREAAADNEAPWAEIPSVTVPVYARRRTEWVRGEQQLLPRLARSRGVDLVHSLGSTAPVWGRFRRVVTIHDVIYRIYPEAHGGLKAKGMSVLVPLAARRSDRIIAPSACTRDDLVSLLKIPAERVDVIPEGVRPPTARALETPDQLRARLRLGARPLVLTLSAKRPHKNIPSLLEAIALVPSERRPVLVLPGYATPWEQRLRDRAEELGVGDDTRFLGWVGEEELEALFGAAACFVFPSLYEGFGLPVLEAMIRGVPVACSDRNAVREVAGEAAQLFDPEQPVSIAQAIETILSNPQQAHRAAALGRAHSETFTWGRTAKATLATYAKAFGRTGAA